MSNEAGHRWFAAIYGLMGPICDRGLRPLRASVVGAARGRVLEIGAGTGLNFPYYTEAESVVATEPDPFMLRRARKQARGQARKLGLTIEFRQCTAEALPLPDASFDTVVSTLTLCTVGEPARALAEVRRVLKPGGVFRFIEHVRGRGAFQRRVQDVLTPVWCRLGAGCHLNRETAAGIEAAGFDITELQRRETPLLPLIIGAARPRG